ncbi:MAG: Oar protein [Lysobacterales bacterium CG17_big_fil_post_rev_8_21_14_2_50_64_11]|nr:MAG: Oar protein [Xanthomonadales bacterium CG17_big_fil_post_rev_8_21_14_2_50_64_11]
MINRNQLRLSRLTLGLIAALATAPAFAQSTSASVVGQVSSDDGRPVAGAQVTILHTQSGTVSRATTNEDGRYSSRGLRVGGPYTITIQRDGYQPTVQENVFLRIASDAQQVNASLQSTATTLEAVQVVAGRPDDVFGTNKMGTASIIGRDKIEAFASIKRDLQDYARLDPRISQTNKQRSEISVAGQNVRFNSVTIDGVSINDTFGLEGNNLPTAKQPISIDAIEQVEVNIANYDVTQSRYSGANINAVTKSGTNEFHGGLLYVNLDDSRIGDDAGQSFNGFTKQETYGGTFSGPLIEDKLFFFISYEDFKSSDIAPDVRLGNADGTDEANEVDAISQSVIDQVAAIASSRYGIPDIGSFSLGGDNDVEDILVKIDWNINDSHRAVFRYNRTEESIRNVSNLSASRNDISLSTTWWDQAKEIEGVVGQLYSDWSDNFSTELKFSYRDFSSAPSFQQRLPFVSIGVGSSDLVFGLDRFRHANDLQTETYNGYFQGDWYLGDHTVRFGVDYERNEIFNLFVQDALGNWRFNSIADFENNRPRSFIFRSSVTGNVKDAAAEFALENYAFFVQDSWQVSDNLSLMLGLRVDVPNVDGRPPFNQVASDTFGFANDSTIDGQELFQPRFGFNYSFDTEYSTQLRGGFGLFQGAAANVWLANPFTNNGLSLVDFGCGTGGLDSCPSNSALLPQFTGDPDNQPEFVSGRQAPSGVDILAKDVQQPSNWKFNVALDKELANGWVVSGEALFTETDHGIHVQHLNLGDPTAIGPDGRQMFWNAAGFNPANWNVDGRSDRSVSSRDNRDRAFGDVILTRDTGKGSGQSYSITLSDPTLENWYWAVGYAYTNADEVSPLTSSRAISNFTNRAAFNPNDAVSSTANTEVRNRITAAVSWKHEFFKGYKTEVSAFYEGRSGTPFSYTFDNDANGDGVFGNDLLFVPGARGDVKFGSTAEEDAFFAFLADNPGLARFAGTTTSRNSARAPWVNNVDLRFTQEVPGLFAGHKGLFAIDILNVGNLIDSDWGHTDTVPFPFNRGIVEFGGVEDGKFVYRFNSPDRISRLTDQGSTLASRWQLQATLRYTF